MKYFVSRLVFGCWSCKKQTLTCFLNF